MSKLAIISDIHANITALDRVIEDAQAQGVNSFACLGDIVGYGPNPNECVSRIQELKCICVKGNHDEYVDSNLDLSNFNPQAREALEWTRRKLSSGQKEWLMNLPYSRRLGRHMIVHATLDNPEKWEYVRNKFDAAIILNNQKTPICFYGHTHVPVSYEHDGRTTNMMDSNSFDVVNGHKYLINVGSVGQPRDGDSNASYSIFDRVARTIENRRVNYDIETVADDILSNGLPEGLAKRLMEAC